MDNESVDKVFQLGLQAGIARSEQDGTPYVLIPEKAQVVSIEQLLPEPVRARALVTTDTLESFIIYVQDFGDPTLTRLFAGPSESPIFEAVLDYHGETKPQWGEHRVKHVPQFSEEWKRWIGIDGRALAQRDFAHFLEDNFGDVARPDGATLLEIAKTLSAKTNVDFLSGVNLDNGTSKLTFAEEMDARAGRSGELTVPNTLELGLPIFKHGERYAIPARLRFRIEDREVQFTVEIPNRHKLLDKVWNEAIERVEKGSNYPVLRGRAQMGGQPLYNPATDSFAANQFTHNTNTAVAVRR